MAISVSRRATEFRQFKMKGIGVHCQRSFTTWRDTRKISAITLARQGITLGQYGGCPYNWITKRDGYFGSKLMTKMMSAAPMRRVVNRIARALAYRYPRPLRRVARRIL